MEVHDRYVSKLIGIQNIFKFFKSADRAAMGYFFGWKMQASTFSSGITIERRETWTEGLYVKDKYKRFWTVGANLKRWMGREEWEFSHLFSK